MRKPTHYGDLMKLVGMDSSLSARRELATDLKYSGDTNDTATMNMWLHKEVMKKLAENAGRFRRSCSRADERRRPALRLT